MSNRSTKTKKPTQLDRIEDEQSFVRNTLKHIQALATERSNNDRKAAVTFHEDIVSQIEANRTRLIRIEEMLKTPAPCPKGIEQAHKFKAGDWVISDEHFTSTLEKSKPYQVKNATDVRIMIDAGGYVNMDYASSNFRLATLEEVSAHKEAEARRKMEEEWKGVAELQAKDGAVMTETLRAELKSSGLPTYSKDTLDWRANTGVKWREGVLIGVGQDTLCPPLPEAEFLRRAKGTIEARSKKAKEEKLAQKPDYEKASQEALAEVLRAKTLFPAVFVNQHEGYAVIREEIDELWDEIKKNQRDDNLPAMRKEAIQGAAMLIRFAAELTPIID